MSWKSWIKPVAIAAAAYFGGPLIAEALGAGGAAAGAAEGAAAFSETATGLNVLSSEAAAAGSMAGTAGAAAEATGASMAAGAAAAGGAAASQGMTFGQAAALTAGSQILGSMITPKIPDMPGMTNPTTIPGVTQEMLKPTPMATPPNARTRALAEQTILRRQGGMSRQKTVGTLLG